MLVLAAILGYPIFESIALALQQVRLGGDGLQQSWVGLANFERLFADDTFKRAALNTAYFSVMEVVLVVGISLAIALVLNHPGGGRASSEYCSSFRGRSPQWLTPSCGNGS